MLDVAPATGTEVVEKRDMIAIRNDRVRNVRADETRSTRDQVPRNQLLAEDELAVPRIATASAFEPGSLYELQANATAPAAATGFDWARNSQFSRCSPVMSESSRPSG